MIEKKEKGAKPPAIESLETNFKSCCRSKKNGWSSHCKTCGTPIVL